MHSRLLVCDRGLCDGLVRVEVQGGVELLGHDLLLDAAKTDGLGLEGRLVKGLVLKYEKTRGHWWISELEGIELAKDAHITLCVPLGMSLGTMAVPSPWPASRPC